MQNSVPWSLWSIGHIPFFANQKNLQKRNFFFPFLKESSRGEKSLDCREFSAEYIVRLDVCINDTVSTQDHTLIHGKDERVLIIHILVPKVFLG